MRILASAGIAVLIFGSTSQAQDAQLVGIDGKCSLTVAGEQHPCKSVFYMMANETGRISFNAPTETGIIGFSGQKDIQPSLGRYVLSLENVLNTRGGKTDRLAATGKCEMRGSDDGHVIHSVTCSAKSEFGEFLLDMKGDGEACEARALISLASASHTSDPRIRAPPLVSGRAKMREVSEQT